MTFNRDKYLSGDFDCSSMDENRNAYNAQIYKGLEWNFYIKDYIIKYIGSILSSYNYSVVEPFANISAFLSFGLFSQAIDFLNAQNCGNVQLETIRDGLASLIKDADDTDSEDSSYSDSSDDSSD